MPKLFYPISIAQQGQTLLIVILMMAVVLTVGLSLASRNVINLKVTTEQENSQKALQAAEAGIEQALVGNTVNNQNLGNNATVTNVNIQTSGGTLFFLNGGNVLNKDDGADIWLEPYSTNSQNLYLPQNWWNGKLTIVWGSQSGDACRKDSDILPNTMAALEVIVISSSQSNQFVPQITRYAVDPCSQRANNYNKFTIAQTNSSITINGVTPPYSTGKISVSNGLIIRVIPLYANTVIGVNAGKVLPTQGELITSEGAAGSTVRQISFYESNETLPSEFYYSLFSIQ